LPVEGGVVQVSVFETGKPSRMAWIAAAAALLLSLSANAQDFDRIVAFGDSWTDDCCSNGPPWVEVLADELGVSLSNRAVGGATSADLIGQVDRYLDLNPSLGALYIYWNLGNDFGAPGALQNISGTAAQIAANMTTALTRLQQAGVENILVLNAVDVSLVPGATAAGVTPQIGQQMASQQNAAVVSVLSTLGLEDSLVDAYSLFASIAADSQFTNTSTSCSAINCSNPNRFLWWDNAHPTAEAHRMIAAGVKTYIEQAVGKPNPPGNLLVE
jgi:phospholipase/lecithinase/hemolysin